MAFNERLQISMQLRFKASKINYIIIISFAFLFSCNLFAHENTYEIYDCKYRIKEFIIKPTKFNFYKLTKNNVNECWNLIDSSNSDFLLLNKSVKNGNKFSALYLSENLKNTDGANLEDSLISLGEFSEKNMETILLFAKNKHISDDYLAKLLVMTPLKFTDNLNAQINVLEKRKRKLKLVIQENLKTKKMAAIKAIDNEIRDTRKILQNFSPRTKNIKTPMAPAGTLISPTLRSPLCQCGDGG